MILEKHAVAPWAWALGICLIGVALRSAAADVSAQPTEARLWAASCASCHGTNGQSAGPVPALAGRSKSELLSLLMAFKERRREGATIMHQYAAGYTDTQLERIAEHFSRQPR